MRCPNCGIKLSFFEMTWSERLFWACLVTIAINQTAQFYDLVTEYSLMGELTWLHGLCK